MIAAPVLLKSLQRLEKELEDDLRIRVTPDAATSPQLVSPFNTVCLPLS